MIPPSRSFQFGERFHVAATLCSCTGGVGALSAGSLTVVSLSRPSRMTKWFGYYLAANCYAWQAQARESAFRQQVGCFTQLRSLASSLIASELHMHIITPPEKQQTHFISAPQRFHFHESGRRLLRTNCFNFRLMSVHFHA